MPQASDPHRPLRESLWKRILPGFLTRLRNRNTKFAGSRRLQSSGLNIGYRNDKDGLRQDFLIQEKPAGKGMLRLDFLTEHRGVTMNVDATENIVFFANAKEEKVMRYSG